MNASATDDERSIRGLLLAGMVVVCVLVFGLGGLAAVTEISGAVVSSGAFVVDSRVKKIQHPTGGIVEQIRVREGDHVDAGDILVKLDETEARTNLATITKALSQLKVRRARLLAERDDLSVIAFSPEIAAQARDPELAQLITSERSLFMLRQGSRGGQQSQLSEQLKQLANEAIGLSQQRNAKGQEIALIEQELAGIRKLWDRKIIAINRLIDLERDVARLQGETGQLTASIAQAKGRASEIRLQIDQIKHELRTGAAAELREVEDRMAELVERKTAAEDQLRRVYLRSPREGVVHQLAVHTIEGVVLAGEPLMYIVPIADPLSIEARIMPTDIDQLSRGQKAIVRLTAFGQRTTPELTGIVSHISADLVVDPQTNAAFYTAKISLPPSEGARLKDITLTPGMPADVFFPMRNRSILSYLIKPLTDQMVRVFREE